MRRFLCIHAARSARFVAPLMCYAALVGSLGVAVYHLGGMLVRASEPTVSAMMQWGDDTPGRSFRIASAIRDSDVGTDRPARQAPSQPTTRSAACARSCDGDSVPIANATTDHISPQLLTTAAAGPIEPSQQQAGDRMRKPVGGSDRRSRTQVASVTTDKVKTQVLGLYPSRPQKHRPSAGTWQQLAFTALR